MSSITIDMHEVYDETSYKKLFSKYSGLISKLITDFITSRNISLHPSEIEDIHQEVAAQVLKYDYISRYKKEKTSFITWLNIICRTTAIDHYRRNRRWMAFVLEEARAPERGEELPPPFSLPAGVLTGRQAEIVTLLFGEGLSAGEAADRLGITARTVRSLKFQALARLREHYGATDLSREDPEPLRSAS